MIGYPSPVAIAASLLLRNAGTRRMEQSAPTEDQGRAGILKKNEPALRAVSEPVPQGKDMTQLVTLMRELMNSNTPKGAGLAANQVGSTWRVIVLGGEGTGMGVEVDIINPVITKASKNMFDSVETCLSCPGVEVKVRRHKQVTVCGFDLDWNPVKLKMRGFNAACVQHENDHLDGITLLTRQQDAELAKIVKR